MTTLIDVFRRAVEEYLTTTAFSFSELPEWHGKNGKARGQLLLDSLPRCKDALPILLYAVMQINSKKLRGIVAQRVVNSGVLGEGVSERMQFYRTEDLRARAIRSVREALESQFKKQCKPTNASYYARLLKALNYPYGVTSLDIAVLTNELLECPPSQQY